jgi:nucleotide-binding universal stress UspA family protein
MLVVRAGPDGEAQPPYDEDYFRIDESAVVVGVSDETCVPAVREALAEGRGRGRRVHAVYAWTLPDMPVYGLAAQTGTATEIARQCAEGGEALLGETVSRARNGHTDGYEDGEIVKHVVNGRRTQVMIDASRSASLVVLATHHRAGRMGRHLGPVTHALLHHAHAPVLLVPVG